MGSKSLNAECEDTPTEFELGDTAADIQRRRDKREWRGRRQRNNKGIRGKGMKPHDARLSTVGYFTEGDSG